VRRSDDRYLTTHVGSLIRPENLRAYARAMAEDEPIDQDAYEAELGSSVAEVVQRQIDAGIDVISDGEYGKASWTNYVTGRITGFEVREVPRPRVSYHGWDAEGRFKEWWDRTPQGQLPSTQAVCVGPITYPDESRRQMTRDVANFKAALQGKQVAGAFLPVIAPCSISVSYRNEYYKSEEEMLFAVADALHEEYRIITDAGFILQTDDAILADLYDQVVDNGIDYRKWVAMNIEALNWALRDIPEEQVRYHLCWGSWPGPHTTDVPLAKIADLLLTIKAQAYAIEAANPMHAWEWVVWQDTKLPEGKILLPGMISHAASHVEHPELIAQRIEQFARVVGPENVIASSDCGFAQSVQVQRQHPEIMWAKLESLAEGARIATARR
jgi:5-methyltetrahydropteroyltriglutamate--homocysteine methyltransferase